MSKKNLGKPIPPVFELDEKQSALVESLLEDKQQAGRLPTMAEAVAIQAKVLSIFPKTWPATDFQIYGYVFSTWTHPNHLRISVGTGTVARARHCGIHLDDRCRGKVFQSTMWISDFCVVFSGLQQIAETFKPRGKEKKSHEKSHKEKGRQARAKACEEEEEEEEEEQQEQQEKEAPLSASETETGISDLLDSEPSNSDEEKEKYYSKEYQALEKKEVKKNKRPDIAQSKVVPTERRGKREEKSVADDAPWEKIPGEPRLPDVAETRLLATLFESIACPPPLDMQIWDQGVRWGFEDSHWSIFEDKNVRAIPRHIVGEDEDEEEEGAQTLEILRLSDTSTAASRLVDGRAPLYVYRGVLRVLYDLERLAPLTRKLKLHMKAMESRSICKGKKGRRRLHDF